MADGAQGVQGIQGNWGVQGYTGNQGNIGNQGVQGFQGIQGHKGSHGNFGNQGPIGLRGIQGTQGEPGYAGSQGHRGLAGAMGAPGNQGNQGNQGAQGIQGNQGNQGPTTTGPQGVTGTITAVNTEYEVLYTENAYNFTNTTLTDITELANITYDIDGYYLLEAYFNVTADAAGVKMRYIGVTSDRFQGTIYSTYGTSGSGIKAELLDNTEVTILAAGETQAQVHIKAMIYNNQSASAAKFQMARASADVSGDSTLLAQGFVTLRKLN